MPRNGKKQRFSFLPGEGEAEISNFPKNFVMISYLLNLLNFRGSLKTN